MFLGALITTVAACVLIMINVGMRSSKETIVFPKATADGFFQGKIEIMEASYSAYTKMTPYNRKYQC